MTDQIPPADRLAQVRAMLKVFGDEENQLKTLMINDPSARSGNAYCVDVVEITSKRTDIKELRAAYPDAVDEHTHTIKTVRVELRGIDQDTGEIVSARKLRSATA